MTRKSRREIENRLATIENEDAEEPFTRYSIAELLSLSPISETRSPSNHTGEFGEDSE